MTKNRDSRVRGFGDSGVQGQLVICAPEFISPFMENAFDLILLLSFRGEDKKRVRIIGTQRFLRNL